MLRLLPNRLVAELSYDMSINNILVSPYIDLDVDAQRLKQLRIGTRFDWLGGGWRDDIRLELFDEQRELFATKTDYSIGIEGILGF